MTSSPVFQADGADAARPRIGVGHQLGLFDQAVLGGENDVAPFTKFPHREKRRNLFAGLEIEQIDDRLAARRTARLRQLVDLDPVDFPDRW